MTRYSPAACGGFFIAFLVVSGGLAGCGYGSGSINGPVSVAAGEKTGDISTVNGPVNVGDGATIDSARGVNGNVKLGANVTAGSVKTVNGDVVVGDASKIREDVLTVNGVITLGKGVDVSGKLTNVNGAITLTAAHVAGVITTVNGDITVGADSKVDGGIHVEKPQLSTDKLRVLRIVIGPRAVVGPMVFEHEVKLLVSDSAQTGTVEGATAEKFSGDEPPSG